VLDGDLVGTDVLGDAAGLAVSMTLVLRMASSSRVLPWSTWPMTVTTGGRGFEQALVLLLVLGLKVDVELLEQLACPRPRRRRPGCS
jgi:hypothetical protein